MNQDSYATTRPALDWARVMDAVTSRFDAMLERLGWFEESFVVQAEPKSDEVRSHNRQQ